MTEKHDICITGSGLIAKVLALGLARMALKVRLVTSSTAQADKRFYAVSAATQFLLESIGCWQQLAVTNVSKMIILDDASSQERIDFNAPLGNSLNTIVSAQELHTLIDQAIAFQPLVELSQKMDTQARLTFICQGRQSQYLKTLGLAWAQQAYNQTALASIISTEKPHHNIAYQWLLDNEVVGVLPLFSPHQRALIWARPMHELPLNSANLSEDSNANCLSELERITQAKLGAVALQEPAAYWPLFHGVAARWWTPSLGKKYVLVGDSAHVVHPMSGLGLNLGLGDVACLLRLLGERAYWRAIDDDYLLNNYQRERKAAYCSVGGVIHGLQRLFIYPQTRLMRTIGMTAFNHMHGLKAWLIEKANF